MTTADIRKRVLENRLRRIGDRTGYRVHKSGPNAFMVTDARTGVAVLGLDGGRPFAATLAEIKAFLLEKEDQRQK